VVKQLWVYIKDNDLQNPSNKREIMCDPKLKAVFGVEKIDMFRMNRVLGESVVLPLTQMPLSDVPLDTCTNQMHEHVPKLFCPGVQCPISSVFTHYLFLSSCFSHCISVGIQVHLSDVVPNSATLKVRHWFCLIHSTTTAPELHIAPLCSTRSKDWHGVTGIQNAFHRGKVIGVKNLLEAFTAVR